MTFLLRDSGTDLDTLEDNEEDTPGAGFGLEDKAKKEEEDPEEWNGFLSHICFLHKKLLFLV